MPKTNAPYGPEIRVEAQRLYVLEFRSIADISRLLGPSEQTLYKWRDDGNWATIREARSMSGPLLASKIRASMALIMVEIENEGRVPNAEESNRMAQMHKIAHQTDSRASYKAHAIETMSRFERWLKHRNAGLHAELMALIPEFTTDLVESSLT